MSIPKTFYIWLKPIRLGSNKCHMVSEIKDGDIDLVVYRNWSRNENGWRYYVEMKLLIEHKIEHNAGANGKMIKTEQL